MNIKLQKVFIALSYIIVLSSMLNAQVRKNVASKWKPENEWVFYSPPSNAFSIRVPEVLESETTSSVNGYRVAMGNDELTLSKCVKSINYYYLRSQYRGDKDRLVIREIDVSLCRESWDELAKTEAAFIAKINGGMKIHSDQRFNFFGLYGRDIIYETGKFYPGTDSSPIYNKIRLGNTGSRLYIATYYREEGTLGEEFSILQSLRPKICLN